MQLVKLGGSFGTITGDPDDSEAWPLAATYIQWLNVWSVIGFPAITATELPGIPPPQAERPTASTKKAPSAMMYFFIIVIRGRMVAGLARQRVQPSGALHIQSSARS